MHPINSRIHPLPTLIHPTYPTTTPQISRIEDKKLLAGHLLVLLGGEPSKYGAAANGGESRHGGRVGGRSRLRCARSAFHSHPTPFWCASRPRSLHESADEAQELFLASVRCRNLACCQSRRRPAACCCPWSSPVSCFLASVLLHTPPASTCVNSDWQKP